MRLQPHLDLTKMGVGVILDVEAKEDGVAKAALVRFEGGPRTGLWYSIGSLEHERTRPVLTEVVVETPAPAKVPAGRSTLGHDLKDVRRREAEKAAREARDSRWRERVSASEQERELLAQLDALRAEVAEERVRAGRSWAQGWLDPAELESLLESRPESTPQERLIGFLQTSLGAEVEAICVLLFARGGTVGLLSRWLRALHHRFPRDFCAALRRVRRSLDARPLWRWERLASWPSWLLPDGLGSESASRADSERPPAGTLLDERQLILRGWLFPGERMRVLLRELRRGVPGVETEREALTWIELRLRELGWWRPLQVRPFEPAFLSRNDLRNSVADALPAATQAQLESLLRGAQRAGIVRSPAEAAAWLRAWVEVWISKTQPQPEPELPEALRGWDLIQRGWLLDSVRIRALLAKQERARERREPLYLQSPLAWSYCALAELGWLQPRRPSLKPLTLDRMPRLRPSQLSAELGAALRQAQSAGILRCDAELETYALAWIEEDCARRLGEALEREDLGGALEALGGA